MRRIRSAIGRAIGRYLSEPISSYHPLTTSPPAALAATLRPGDVLLVEGNTRVSGAIKYLTQSTWSHACLYVGDVLGTGNAADDPPVLVEVDMVRGCWGVPLSRYAAFHTRICRPIGLTAEDVERLVQYVVSRLGHAYDLKNMIDLARYLLPMPPLPSRWRRRLMALGSGDPTKAICSTLIAQAFQSVGYPVLPGMRRRDSDPGAEEHNLELLYIRHYSLYTPRDFDISPYFEVVKPTIEQGFTYRSTAAAAPALAPADASALAVAHDGAPVKAAPVRETSLVPVFEPQSEIETAA
jgi:hypothetical protein